MTSAEIKNLNKLLFETAMLAYYGESSPVGSEERKEYDARLALKMAEYEEQLGESMDKRGADISTHELLQDGSVKRRDGLK